MTALETVLTDRLESVNLIRRTLFFNGNMPHLLPLNNGMSVQELADEILRGCVEYGLFATYYAAHSMALDLSKQILNDRSFATFYGNDTELRVGYAANASLWRLRP